MTELFDNNTGYEKLPFPEQELKRLMVPIIVSGFLEVLQSVKYDNVKKELHVKSERFSFDLNSKGEARNVKGSLSQVEKGNLKKCGTYFKEMLQVHDKKDEKEKIVEGQRTLF